MPTTRRDYAPLPFVRPAYEPDTRTLRELLMLAGQARANTVGRQGEARAQGLMTFGQLIGQGLAGLRQGKEREQAALATAQRQEREDALKLRDQQLREADLLARVQEREDARAEREQASRYKMGTETAEDVGYGPMSEMQMENVLQGPAAGRARYAFGPGTADGPELMPTQAQQRGMETERQIQAMGGQIGPNGQVVMPPKPEREPNPTEASLAMLAARGDVSAQKALERLRALRAPQFNPNGEPLEPVMGPEGFAIYAPRSRAVGQRVPTTREQPTEDERKSAGFYKQMQESIAILDELENKLTDKDLYQIQTLPQEALIGAINRGEMSEAAKRYLRAFEQFTEARMRPVSGAAISDSEFARDRRTYARQYGETPALAKDRKSARQSALESLRTRASRALPKDDGKSKDNDPLGIRK